MVNKKSKYTAKKLGGKALRYPDAELFMLKGMEYVLKQKTLKEPVLYTELLLHMNLNMDTFNDYAKRAKYSSAVKELKLHVQSGYEKNLFSGKPVGSIFALKAFGWQDGDNQAQSASVTAKWGKKH